MNPQEMRVKGAIYCTHNCHNYPQVAFSGNDRYHNCHTTLWGVADVEKVGGKF